MRLSSVRDELHRTREQLLAGDTAAATDGIDRVLRALEPAQLLTPAQAAEFFGIQSDFVVKLWCNRDFLNCETGNGCFAIPLSEVERVRESAEVTAMRIADEFHAASWEIGEPDGLTEEKMIDLSAARPGILTWKRS
ncbi:MAG TPA: hypothetical protein VK390_11410 [Propionibacteriaceae bacterium]|nr:hypothetical protein [Propionibacteriaceae bacterium]